MVRVRVKVRVTAMGRPLSITERSNQMEKCRNELKVTVR